MKKALYLIFTAVLAVTFIGCDEVEPVDSGLNQALEFTLEVESVDATSAKIKVSHNGAKEDTWFGFATTESDPLSSLETLVADILASESHLTLKKATKTTYSVKELTPETKYSFVVVGLTDEGEIYGRANSIEFTTLRDMSALVEDDARWKISYERSVDENNDKVEAVTIECEDDDLYYFEYVPEYYLMDESGNLLVSDYVDYVANGVIPEFVNAGYTYKNFCYEGGGTLLIPRLESGKYYAIVIGMSTENVHDGSYAVQEFTVKEETATAEYEKWFGTYTLTSANDVSYEITISHYDNNFMYAVTGWEAGAQLEVDNNGDGYPDGMDFNTAFGEWIPAFPLYFEDGKVIFNEYVMTTTSVLNEKNQEIECTLGLHGYAMNDSEQLTIVLTEGEEPLAVGELTDDNNGVVNPSKLVFEGSDGSKNEKDCFALGYVAIATDYSDYFLWNAPAELPYTLTRKAAAQTTALSVLSKDNANGVRKTVFGRKSFNAELSAKTVKELKRFERK